MTLLALIRIAFRAIGRSSLRSVIAALGVCIGVASVIAMVSLGHGAKTRIEDSFAGLDANRINISARMPMDPQQDNPQTFVPQAEALTLADFRAIRGEFRHVAAASVYTFFQSPKVEANGRKSRALVTGTDASSFVHLSRRLEAGAAFLDSDVNEAANVCLTSEYLAKRLFGEVEAALGRVIRINDVPFVIIGVLRDEHFMMDLSRRSPGDTNIVVPYTSLLRRLDREAPIDIVLRAEDPMLLSAIQARVDDLLEQRRGNRKSEFVTTDVTRSVGAYKEGSETMSRLLGTIGGIALFIGGLGIANIMLMGVTERGREIGVRLAIGTRQHDVKLQFLLEAVILSLMGGVLGIALGAVASWMLTYLNDWPTEITARSIITAFVVSATLGVLSGYYPARRAAALNPIEVLRRD